MSLSMRTGAGLLGILLGVLGLTSPPAQAHGGSYVGPPTPTGPARPATGSPAGPGTTGVGAPPGGALTGPGGLLQPSRTRAGRGSAVPGIAPDQWQLWWRHNREPYLPRHSAAPGQPRSGDAGFLTGRTRSRARSNERFREAEVRATLLPVLASVLGESSPEIVDSALIAMARCTAADQAGPFLQRIVDALPHAQRSVREAAILALGILGAPDGMEMLRAIAADTRLGRSLLGETASLDDRHRALAALALGLSAEADSVPVLLEVARSPTSTRQLASCAVLSLGLHHGRAHEVAVALASLLTERSLDREVRAQVPIALQRLPTSLGRSQLQAVVDTLQDRDSPMVLRRSCAIALGNLGTVEDPGVLEALERAVVKDTDLMTRNFACIALGRIAERWQFTEDLGEAGLEVCRDLARTLVGHLRSGRQQAVQPYAALGLGLLLRAEAFGVGGDAFASLRESLCGRLRAQFLSERDPSLQGAIAIALGLASRPEPTELLRGALRRQQNPALVGHLAEALGMLGDRGAIPVLRDLLRQRGRTEEMRISVVRALGLLEDPELQELLLGMLAEAKSVPEASALARGLGLSGDRSAAPPLLSLLTNRREQDLRRAFAAVAVGLLAEKTRLPWNVVYSVDSNYTLPNEALEELLLVL